MDDGRTETLSPLKQALLQLREMRARLDAIERERSEPIAIIGLGLRFPGGAHDPDSFWRVLRDGVDTITEVPADRWDIHTFYDPNPEAPGKMTTRHGAFLDDVEGFDAAFFGISPREAISMDPQQRLLLEIGWEALEHAGQSPERLAGSDTGVFLGIANSDYFRMLYADPAQIDAYTSTGNAASVAAGRLSYWLGLHGPNMALDTACSSSLVAVHLAVQSLRRGDCRLALAGGINLILSPEVNINFSKAQGMMAPDGRCKTFDARADGYVRGEGAGVVVLKRLSQALAEGDAVLAVIRGSAINHDGRSGGLTAPNGPAQEAVLRAALADAQLAPGRVGYVEAHGTGTSLGDPIEVHALGAALGEGRSADRPLLVGSVKTNLGHLEAAAGIAGLIKIVLALQHGAIPPHLHFQNPNPYITWDRFPVAVTTTLTPWPESDQRPVAGVSSFGFSGTNAHVIIEAAPLAPPAAASDSRRAQLLTLSARSQPALRALAARNASYLEQNPAAALADIAFTANTGRSHLTHRLAMVAGSAAQVRQRLSDFSAGQTHDGAFYGHALPGAIPDVAFLFTGQGSQYVGMGRQLYDSEPVFRDALDRCDEWLRAHLERPLLAVLYPEPGVDSPLEEMRYAQPAIFALEYALAQLWRAWGIEPAAVVGHSLGEYVAACVAGVFSVEDGLKLVAARGRLMHSLPDEGAMVTVFADEASVAEALTPYSSEVAIAAVNSPETVVISGRRDSVHAALEALRAQKIRARALPVAQASHSPLIEPILDAFSRIAAEVTYAAPQLTLISGLTGKPVNAETVANPDYWRRHFRETVRFADAAASLFASGYRIFIEIGPNPTLLSLAQRCVPEPEQAAWLPSLRQGWEDEQTMLESLGALYVRGAAVDWVRFAERWHSAKRLHLPTYPWEHKPFWSDAARPRAAATPARWANVVEAGRRQAGQAPLDLDIARYPQLWRSLDRLALAYITNTLVELRAFTQPGGAHSADSLLATHNILPTYRSLMARWLSHLAAEGLLDATADGKFVAVQPLRAMELGAAWRAADSLLADLPFLREYVQRCGERLTAVITGGVSALETLFPDGSFETTEALYQHWAMSRYFNHLVRAMVEAVEHSAPAGSVTRCLEIGAGTGSTTAALLPVLPSGAARYQFTDVSDLFLSRAAEKFAGYSFVRYGRLDIERSPESQGYSEGSFDIVIAANVLHATADLRGTLQHVRGLLAPGGMLILYEATTPQRWFDITTGLIEGWQRFDDGLRDDSPLLAPEVWERLLIEAGFESVAAFPESGSPAKVLGQHVLVARNLAGPLAGAGESPIAASHEAEHDRPQRAAPLGEPEPHAGELLHQLSEALPSERVDLLVDFVRGHLTRILRLDPSDRLDRHSRLMDLGVDSLMAVELRNRLTRSLALSRALPATLIFDHPTIEAVARYMADEALSLVNPESAEPATPTDSIQASPLEALSDAEVEALLLEKLKTLPH